MNSLEFRRNIPGILGPLKPAFREYSAVFLSSPFHKGSLVFRKERSLTVASPIGAANGGNVSESNRSAALRPLSGFEDHAHHRMRYAPGFSLPAVIPGESKGRPEPVGRIRCGPEPRAPPAPDGPYRWTREPAGIRPACASPCGVDAWRPRDCRGRGDRSPWPGESAIGGTAAAHRVPESRLPPAPRGTQKTRRG